ncbi:hypothetical protein [Comamonas sediminis]|uniref:Uncharacterized protein n=1 Tax=Comamonas sediminis TaxID=1783360 RepID=A0ABV4B789_9BURK
MASTVDTSVKFAHSSMPGAPVINGQAGSRLSALKAFLVTGFGVKAVDAGGTISAGKCRLPFGSGASAAAPNSVVLVSGATPAAINGEQKVTAVGAAWVEFATALPDGLVTGGGISFKIAPLGWEEVYSKTNVSVFRPTDPRGTRPYLRVDDSNALYAIVQMFETMSDVDTGTNGTPARFWFGRSSASATGVVWTMAGDSRAVIYAPHPFTAGPGVWAQYAAQMNFFGDLLNFRSGDAYCAVISGATDTAVSDVSGDVSQTGANGVHVMRIAAGIGTQASASLQSWALGTSGAPSGNHMGSAPARADASLRFAPILVSDGGAFVVNGPRGAFPGIFHCPQTGVSSMVENGPQQTAGSGDFLGRSLLSAYVGAPQTNGPQGVAFIDITGPWRPQ